MVEEIDRLARGPSKVRKAEGMCSYCDFYECDADCICTCHDDEDLFHDLEIELESGRLTSADEDFIESEDWL